MFEVKKLLQIYLKKWCVTMKGTDVEILISEK